MLNIKIQEKYSWKMKENALNTSLILGFHSTAASFPITSEESGVDIPNELSELNKLFNQNEEKWPDNYISATKNAEAIEDLDWRKKKGLESMFLKGFLMEDENFDQLPDKLNFKIQIPEDSDNYLLASACNFAFRYGMETTAFKGSILTDENWKGNSLIFEESHECGMEFVETEEGKIAIYIRGKGNDFIDFSSLVCERFPLLPGNRNWVDQIKEMTDSFSMRNLDGELAYLNANKNNSNEKIEAYISPEAGEKVDEIKKFFPEVEFKNHKSLKKIYEKSYDIPWEVDVFKSILKDRVYEEIKPEDKVEIHGVLSEDIHVRNQLKNEIEDELSKKDIFLEDIKIICAYKQGISWIEEEILEKLKGQDIDSIKIGFKPFLPEGETDWLDEDGATPSYNNVGIDDKDKWFDMPIRYLQELYPIDDIIEKELDISREKVEFYVYEGKEDITYEFTAFNGEEEILNDNYKASYSERPYLDSYPNMGKVHPSTGLIRVVVNGEELVNENIKTDLENIWDIYQKEVLPEAKDYAEGISDGNIDENSQPLFAQLRLEIDASEPDYNLPFREDIISSLNAFHQDLYFVGSDYFKNYGLDEHDVLIDAPGLILPIVNRGEGRPKFKVTLYDNVEKTPCIRIGDRLIKSQFDRREVELYMLGLEYDNGKINGVLRTDIEDEKLVESYMELLDKGILDASKKIRGIDKLKLLTSNKSYEASIEKTVEIEKNLSIEEIDLMEDSLIGYDQYIEIIDKLKYVPGIDVYELAKSYQGRKIYAIEILPKEEGYISRTKRITNLPSQLINSRHHANEVSSTNSAFMLLKKILIDKKYESLADKLNLVIVPMENVDGSDIHYQLQKDNPNWKLHVARFNSIGKEFYHEHFDPDTIHKEAMGLTRLWEKYLPDVLVDNHGVPSHEWDQQFSGYTSPSYKGFWLPRSLLYGYFWTVSDDEYSSNYLVNKKMEEVIAESISKDDEITGWNKEWMSRFEKYAHAWMPKMFPADYYKNMINYWIPFEFDPEHRYPSIRFPWITTVSYTSEVADETAQGEYLNLCARTHVCHDEAIIEMLMNANCLFENEFKIEANEISIKNIRHRPLITE